MKKIILIIFTFLSFYAKGQTQFMMIKDTSKHLTNFHIKEFIKNNVKIVDTSYVLKSNEEICTSHNFIQSSLINNLIDYVQGRFLYMSMDFNIQNDVVKEAMCEFIAVDMNTFIAYYMGKGLTQNEALVLFLKERDNQISYSAEALCNRANSSDVFVNLMMFLGESQSVIFNDAVRNFKDDLCSIALLGTEYGDNRDGLMDYIESTGSYANGGLKSYIMSDDMIAIYGSQEAARLALVDKLKTSILFKKDIQ